MDTETKTVRAPASLRALVAGAIDYAGLFPPADLAMPDAVRNYAGYLNGADVWALGRFIVPASRLAEFEHAAESYFSESKEWKLSVLAGTNPGEELKQIADFNTRHITQAAIDTIETKAFTSGEIQNIASVVPKSFHVFIEIPISADPTELIRSIGKSGVNAKVRTGGVTANAFPAASNVERFIRVCVTEMVKFKATAGLHHPIRSEYNMTYKPGSERGKMYGYLNIFLAAALIKNGMKREDAIRILGEESAEAFRFSDEGVEWRSFHLENDELQNMRHNVALSFGSCSFREPLDDLKSLGLMKETSA